MVRRHKIKWLFIGAAIGVLITWLALILNNENEKKERYLACYKHHYDRVDLTNPDYTSVDTNGKHYYFGNTLEVLVSENMVVFFDDFSGQMREYHHGVLSAIYVVEYEGLGKDYKKYQIRSSVECEEIRKALDGNSDSLKDETLLIWNTASGETFVD